MPNYAKIIIGIIIAAGVVYAGNVLFFALPETEHDFRQAKWGMSPEEVRQSENPELEIGAGDNFLFYEDNISGYDALISYMFGVDNNDSLILIAANYDFRTDAPSPELGTEDFEKIKEFFITEYGKPMSEVGVDMGHGSLNTVTWETRSTDITLSLRDVLSNGVYAIDIAFISKKYKPKLKENLDL